MSKYTEYLEHLIRTLTKEVEYLDSQPYDKEMGYIREKVVSWNIACHKELVKQEGWERDRIERLLKEAFQGLPDVRVRADDGEYLTLFIVETRDWAVGFGTSIILAAADAFDGYELDHVYIFPETRRVVFAVATKYLKGGPDIYPGLY